MGRGRAAVHVEAEGAGPGLPLATHEGRFVHGEEVTGEECFGEGEEGSKDGETEGEQVDGRLGGQTLHETHPGSPHQIFDR